MFGDLFAEIQPDPVALARRRLWARHQHSRVVDPEDNERYTLASTLRLVGELTGIWRYDLDVAACPEAHVATRWLGRQADGSFLDGLSVSWRAHAALSLDPTFWCNPPYDDLASWIERCWLSMIDREFNQGVMLPPGDRAEQPWWHQWVEPYREGRKVLEGITLTTHNLPGRQRFGRPGDPHGTASHQAPFPSVALVWRLA